MIFSLKRICSFSIFSLKRICSFSPHYKMKISLLCIGIVFIISIAFVCLLTMKSKTKEKYTLASNTCETAFDIQGREVIPLCEVMPRPERTSCYWGCIGLGCVNGQNVRCRPGVIQRYNEYAREDAEMRGQPYEDYTPRNICYPCMVDGQYTGGTASPPPGAYTGGTGTASPPPGAYTGQINPYDKRLLV